jgi:hypothetical protein
MADETRRASEIPPEVLDQLLAGYSKPEDLTADDGLFRRLKKALIGCTLRSARSPALAWNWRNETGRCSAACSSRGSPPFGALVARAAAKALQ